MGTYFETHRHVNFDKTFSKVIAKTYLFLAMGFLITGCAAFFVSKSEAIMYAFLDGYFWFIASLIAVVVIAFAFGRMVFAVKYRTAIIVLRQHRTEQRSEKYGKIGI